MDIGLVRVGGELLFFTENQPFTQYGHPLYIRRRSLKRHERNTVKMTFASASGLLPAGIAVYVQRGCAGINRHVVGDERALQERRSANPS